MPRMIRPLLMLSRRAICSASLIGWLQRHLNGGEAYLDALGAGRDRRREGDRINVGARAIVMMLAKPHSVEAEFLAQFGLTQRVGDNIVVGIRRIGLWE